MPGQLGQVEWGENASGNSLRVYDRGYARISAPSFALMAQSTQIHVALWRGPEPPDVPAAPAGAPAAESKIR